MKKIRILIWSQVCDKYLMGILKKAADKFDIEYKDITEVGNADYSLYFSQSGFDNILKQYYPDIIFLHDVTSRNLVIDIPENIKVIVYCDHFHEQFTFFGKSFFDMIPKNNYILFPILDAKNVDRDGVLENPNLKNKIFFMPFMPCLDELDAVENQSDFDTYNSDLSITLSYRGIDYYYWSFGIKSNTFAGRQLMCFLGEIVYAVRRAIRDSGAVYMKDTSIIRMITVIMEQQGLSCNIRSIDEFIKYWVSAIKYSIIPTEYGNCVIDWLIERKYDIKIYGNGWKNRKEYQNYAFGEIPDGSMELNKAYRYSKINVGSSCATLGIHRRVFEAMKNNCLCLQVDTHQSWQFSDWRHYFEDGKDIVIYHDKTELYQKIDYYLSHDEERRKVTDAAWEKLKKCPDIGDLLGNIIVNVYSK